jgi:hypothetical protein
MLADQLFDANCSPVAEEGLFPVSRKSSVLKKTMLAFGKVKPIFNNNSGKMKRCQMEYFDSCSSMDFDFDTSEQSCNDRINNKTSTKSISENVVHDEELDEMKVRASEFPVSVKTQESFDSVTTTHNMKDGNEESDIDTDPKPKSSVYVFARTRKLATNSDCLQLEHASPQPVSGRANTRPFSAKSKRHSLPMFTVQADESLSTPTVIADNSMIKTSHQLTPAASTKLSYASSPATAQKMPAPAMLTPTTREKNPLLHMTAEDISADTTTNKISTNSLTEKSDSDLPQNQVGAVETTWKRLSRAFESGEKVKRQEKDTKDEATPEMVGDLQVLEEDGNDVSKGQNNSKFKTPSRIKKMFGLNRSNTKTAPKTPSSETISGPDAAAMVMTELSAITLSPVLTESPRKPRVFEGPRQSDDMNTTTHSMDYPEIPSTKAVSLGDIKNFAWRRESARNKNRGEKPHRGARDIPSSRDSNGDRKCRSSSHRENSIKDSATPSNESGEVQEPQKSPRRSHHRSSRPAPLEQMEHASETAVDNGANEGANGGDVDADPGGRKISMESNRKYHHTPRRHREARSHNKHPLRHGELERKGTEGTAIATEGSSTSHSGQRNSRCRTHPRRVGPEEATKLESTSNALESDHPDVNDVIEGESRRKRHTRRLESASRSKTGLIREHAGGLDKASSQKLDDTSAQHEGKTETSRKESNQGTRWNRTVRREDEKLDDPYSTLSATTIEENAESLGPASRRKQRGMGDDEDENILEEKRSSQNSSRRRKPVSRRMIVECSGEDVLHESSQTQQGTSSPALEGPTVNGNSPTFKGVDGEINELQRNSVSSRSQTRRSTHRSNDKGPSKPRSQRSSQYSGCKLYEEELNITRHDEGSNHPTSSGLSNIGEEEVQVAVSPVMKEKAEDPSSAAPTQLYRSKSHRRQPVCKPYPKNDFLGRSSHRGELRRSRSLTNLEANLDKPSTTLKRQATRRTHKDLSKSDKLSENHVESPTRRKGASTRRSQDDDVVASRVYKSESVLDAFDDEKDDDTPDRAKSVSLNDTLGRDSVTHSRLFLDDGQQTVLSDDGSLWLDQGSIAYSNIKSSTSVSAAQLVFDSTQTIKGGKSLGVQNA